MRQFESDNFRICLKNHKIRSYRFIALLIAFFNLTVFILLLFSDKYFYDAGASLFLAVAYCICRGYVSKKQQAAFYIDAFFFFVLAGCWVALHNYAIAAGCVLMGILYYFSLQKPEFIFSPTSVKKINFPATEYSWDKFTNVMLRDDILTLDFNNNKLIQWEIDDENNIGEIEFNAFAHQQLVKYAHPEENLYLN